MIIKEVEECIRTIETWIVEAMRKISKRGLEVEEIAIFRINIILIEWFCYTLCYDFMFS